MMITLIACSVIGFALQSEAKPALGKELSIATKPLKLPSVLAKLKLSTVSVSEYEAKESKETARVFRYTFRQPAEAVHRKWTSELLAARWKEESKADLTYWVWEVVQKKGPVVRQAIILHVGKIFRSEGASANTGVDYSAKDWSWVSYNEMVPSGYFERGKSNRNSAIKGRRA